MSQHGVAVATVACNGLSNGFQLRNTALRKRLNARGRCNHLVNCHVERSKKLRIKLLGQDVLWQPLLHVLLTQFSIALRVGQDVINYVVQCIKDLGRHVQPLQFLREFSHCLGVHLGRPCQHFVGKLLGRNLLAHLVKNSQLIRTEGSCGRSRRHAHLLVFHHNFPYAECSRSKAHVFIFSTLPAVVS